ncbi:MAG: hypothetical protein SF051_14190 [Elusimicrobiota bacterium]|nr:hypothetical protein [Elusimicrobiota bacterium]
MLIHMIALLLTAASGAYAESVKSAGGEKPRHVAYVVFISSLQTNGQDNYIRPNVAPLIALRPNAPTKAFIIDSLDPKSPSEPGKTCNVLVGDAASNPDVGQTVFLDSHTENNDVIARYFKVNRAGKLILAIHTVGKRDAKKQPIRGSGKATTLDVTSPAVQRDFKKELDFWLSGRYKKHLKPKAAAEGGEATKKAAAE